MDQSGITMASDTNPSITNIAFVGWRDALRAISDMTPVVAPTFVLALIVETGYRVLPAPGLSIATMLALLLLIIMQSLVLTPLVIAVHRYVLLDEVTQHYRLNPADPRFQRFFGLTLAIRALWFLPLLFPLLFMPALFIIAARLALFVSIAAALVTVVIVAIVTLRTIILFPAIAIDAPGAGWRNAIDDSKGHTWRLFFAFLLASLPLVPLEAIAEWMVGGSRFRSLPALPLAFQTIGVVLMAAVLVLAVSVFAAIASWFYMAFGRRLNGVAPAP
jgi:hypothetical protein